MNWFQGEIVDAIVKSKQDQAIFVVYIEGKDEKSEKITGIIDKVAKKLESAQFVAIKIEGDSVAYQQFTQIYKQVPVPSIYFIGKQGVSLEIVTEVSDAVALDKTLDQVLEKGGYTTAAEQTQNFIASEQATEIVEETQGEPSTSTTNEAPTPNIPEPSVTVEEKVEHAKQLIEKKREEKQKEEEENEKAKELERRKMGQSVQQLKRWQEDQELKNVLEERQKEKRENQKARDRILEQIAQDKAERAAKFNPQPQPQAEPSPAPVRTAANSNTARLQFRMPDGRTATQDFPSHDSLESVHAHIRSNLHLPFSNYTLSTTFPRREFTNGDKSQSLIDLGLTPNAVILILPVNRGVVSTNSSGDGLTGLFWSFLAPFISVLGYIRTFIFGGNNGGTANSESNKRPASSPNLPEGQPKVRRSGETTVIRKQGNVHRLSNKNDSDDENNTWNGNSTQQM